MLSLKQIEEAQHVSQFVRDIVPPNTTFAYVHIDESLSLALERMGSAGIDQLPVVSRANTRQLLGLATLPEVPHAYGVTGERA